MATMNVSLPGKMKEWVEKQVATGRYANASDLIRDLIREDQERAAATAELNILIEEGFNSGVSDRTMEDIRRDVKTELAASRKRAS
ncbi:MAG: type toxin-antitoxin system ParD family antitoxin [Devosia sp.]|uniref:type II toxin-antitoxin system ParD family antitoxin n=1 Tax=Devosia sp. TaxID=1871048 RepID=UPI00262F81B4|nr:type II toxin-antitoxin system ParD family antitoxin [Devosia sp.]MDB5539834.1 type toxin-antitoxin system ParD family antitoxin [Devosia sp.]